MPHMDRAYSVRRTFIEDLTVRSRQAGSRSDDGEWTAGTLSDVSTTGVSMPVQRNDAGAIRRLMPGGVRKGDARLFYLHDRNIQPLRLASETGGPSGADMIQRDGVDYVAWASADESGGDGRQNDYRKILGIRSEAVSSTRSYAAVDTALRKWVRKGSGLAAGYVIDIYDSGPVPGGAYAAAKLISARLSGTPENVLVGANMRVRAYFEGEAQLVFRGPGSTDRSLKFQAWASSDAGQTSADSFGLTIRDSSSSITAQPMGSEYEDDASLSLSVGFTAQASSAESSFASGELVIWSSERAAPEAAITLTGGSS